MTRLLASLAVLTCFACRDPQPPASPTASPPLAKPGLRISMAALHDAGGVPPGWKLTPPPGDPDAGQRAFVDLGCDSCHLVRADLAAAPPDTEQKGPELTTMGGHHPPEYFLESILTPDAVLIEGPGYIGDDGRSTMPSYPDLTVTQLADLVAYLQTLTGPGGGSAKRRGPIGLAQRPTPPKTRAGVFYVQTYDAKPGRLADLEAWFHDPGRAAFLAVPGLVSIDTYVDNTRPGPGMIAMFGFADDAALSRFMQDPAATALKDKVDEFSGAHGHQIFRTPPVYRVESLSTP